MIRRVLLAAAALLAAIPAAAAEVAVTIDDLPVAVWNVPLRVEQDITDRLLAGLKRNGIVAIGFVNEGKLEGPDRAQRVKMLESWLDAGMDLGNHGLGHKSFTTTPLAAYQEEVVKGEVETKRLLAARGRTIRYWRHPFLHTGPTLETRRAFEGWLTTRGYRIAPVTLENADWMFATVYDDAVTRGDDARRKAVGDAYIAFTRANLRWQMEAARRLFGRDIRHTLLIHANRLNADRMNEVAGVLTELGLEDVPLERALADPVYARADSYAGPDGRGWLQRWADDMPNLPSAQAIRWSTKPEVAADIQADWRRLSGG